MIDRIAEALDEVVEGIEEQEGAVLFGKDVQGINDGSQIKERLEDDGDDVLDVPGLDVGDGGNQREAQGKKEVHGDENGDKEQTPGEVHLEKGHEAEEDKSQDDVVDIAGQNTREGENDFRDIDAADHSLVVDDRGGGNDDGLLDHHPGNEAGKEEDDVVIDLEFDDFRKHHSQDEEKKKRIEDRP